MKLFHMLQQEDSLGLWAMNMYKLYISCDEIIIQGDSYIVQPDKLYNNVDELKLMKIKEDYHVDF